MKKNFYFFSNVIFLLCLLPYVSFVPTSFDTQPFAIIISAIYILVTFSLRKSVKIPSKLFPFFIVLSYAFLLFFISSNQMSALRSLVGYASVAILSVVGWRSFRYVKGIFFVWIVNIWLLFALMQTFVSKTFGSFVLVRQSTSLDRGVTSLAVEPSSYSIMCMFFFVLNDFFYVRGDYNKKIYNYIFGITVFQLLLSRAALGFVLLAIYLMAKILSSGGVIRKVRKILSISLVGAGLYYIITTVELFQETRIGSLISKAEYGVTNLIMRDGSIADRLSHILISFVSLFHSYGIGFGLGEWDNHAIGISNTSGDFIREVSSVNFTLGRIMSGWGTAIFELGIVGVLFLATFLMIMRNGIKNTDGVMKSVYKSSTVTLFFTMLMSVSLSFPLFGYIIGAALYLQKEEAVQSLGTNKFKKKSRKKVRFVWKKKTENLPRVNF